MKFFHIDAALFNTIIEGTEPVRIRIILYLQAGEDLLIGHDSIETAYFISTAGQSGLSTSNAEITFYRDSPIPEETNITEAEIYFTCGENSSYLHRFTMYPDDSNLRVINSGGGKTRYRIKLEDIPARLKRLEASKDWSSPQVIIDAVISDKEHPEQSLFHLIAQKAGINPGDTESCTIPLSIPYAVIDRDTWNDLSDLANTFKAVIEGGTDKKIILSGSDYQSEHTESEDVPELDEQMFYRADEQSAGNLLKNDIRLRWNKPERLAIQTIWKYDEAPVNYDTQLVPSYPFSLTGEKRRIEQDPPAEAPYTAIIEGKEVIAVYVDMIDSGAAVSARMQSINDAVNIETFDITTHKDKALIKLTCSDDDEIKNLCIEGRPIVIRQNCSCYLRDEDSITENGLKVLNVTGRYFLHADIDGTPHYQDWSEKTLLRLKKKRKQYTLYTQYCIFFIRTGALTYLNKLNRERPLCKITSIEMSYNRKDGFEIKTSLLEE